MSASIGSEAHSLAVPAAPEGMHFGTTWGPPTSYSQFPDLELMPFRIFDRNAKIARRPVNRAPPADDHPLLSLSDIKESGSGVFKQVLAPLHYHRKTTNIARKQIHKRNVAAKEAGDIKTKVVRSSHNKRINRLNHAKIASNLVHGPEVLREYSVPIQPYWERLEEVSFDQFRTDRLTVSPPQVEDLKWTGTLKQYDDSYDSISAKYPKKLNNHKVYHFDKKATEDPVLSHYEASGEGDVFMTDDVLAHLMAATRSVLPWDIEITYNNGVISFDARNPKEFNQHVVNEREDTPAEIFKEATRVHRNFVEQVHVVNNKKQETAPAPGEPQLEENPLWDANEAHQEGFAKPASVAFRYRKFHFPQTSAQDQEINIVARTTVHAVSRRKTAQHPFQLLSICSVNEFQSHKHGWKQIMESKSSEVISEAISKGTFKLAKCTAGALLAGTDYIKLGFVTRVSKSRMDDHEVISTQSFDPMAFAAQLSLHKGTMWGVVRWVIDRVRAHAANFALDDDSGNKVYKFVLVKTPNAPRMELYSLPGDGMDYFIESEGDYDSEYSDESEYYE